MSLFLEMAKREVVNLLYFDYVISGANIRISLRAYERCSRLQELTIKSHGCTNESIDDLECYRQLLWIEDQVLY